MLFFYSLKLVNLQSHRAFSLKLFSLMGRLYSLIGLTLFKFFQFCLFGLSVGLVSLSLELPIVSTVEAEEQLTSLEVKTKLEVLKSDIKAEQELLQKIDAVRETINDNLETLKTEIVNKAKKQEELKSELASIQSRLQVISSSTARGEAIVEEQKELFKRRAKGLYKSFRGGSILDFVFNAERSDELARRLRYAKLLADYDKTNLQRFSKLVAALSREKSLVQESEAKASRTISNLVSLEESLALEKSKQEDLLLDLQKREQESRESLSRLEGSLEKLEGLLSAVMGGAKIVSAPQPTKIAKAIPRKNKAPAPASKTKQAPRQTKKVSYSGGLASVRRKLPYPVRGSIVRKFGKHKHEKFKDQIYNKGVDFQANQGDPVRAVANGKVVFSEVLPEFGNVVILDHGKRYYTLYGRLGVVGASMGDLLLAGAELGRVGRTDDQGRSFYFEIRHQGKARNPAKYFEPS